MNDTLRNAGIIAMIFVAAFVLYRMIYEVKQIDLNSHMELLGNKFLALVPEGSGRDSLAENYGDFLDKVKKREVEPEYVERVAAGMLNAGSAGKELTHQQAEAIMRLAEWPPAPETAPASPATIERPALPAQDKWKELDDRMESVYRFTLTIQEANEELARKENNVHELIQFKIDPELRVVLDEKARELMQSDRLKSMARQIEHLEEKKMLEWKEKFHEEMEQHRVKMDIELKRMHAELEKPGVRNVLEKVEALEIVNSVLSLDSMGIHMSVNVDSILRTVEMQIEAAVGETDE